MLQSNISTTFICSSKRGRKKRKKEGNECLVCGGESVGINFGVYSCAPCKAFFRRNATKLGSYEFICKADGDCPITSDTRRSCNCCRLAKCFRVGMDKKCIRTDDERLERNQLIEYNRQKRAETKEPIYLVNLLKYSHKPYSSLTSNDQILLQNITNAYEQTCISLRYHVHLQMKNDDTLSIGKFMNSVSHMYIALVDYIKCIPEFTNLSIKTRISLLKNNLNQIFRLNSALIIHATGPVDDTNTVVFKHVFPDDLYLEQCRCVFNLIPFVYDPILLKLIIIVLIFSTSLSTRYDINQQINSIENISSIQDFYIELLWRYILYRCSTYRQSVQLLTLFITRLLHSQIVNEKLSTYISQISPNQVNQLEPIMKAMWLDEKNK
ncbi:unnamed protein product [Adineta steineri]|uniref:Nuclear receptor domain-containing protein n=1 Tax=Adineta steineri TaxID=433720 RepID=A0A818QGY3_9BILA|nr:unnamed protein product [Adineta steineri]